MIVSSGDVVDRIEFTTNFGRNFKAGGSGGEARHLRFDAPNVRVIALGGGMGGHMHNVKAHYIILGN